MKNESELVWSERELLRMVLATRRFSTSKPLSLEAHLRRLIMLMNVPEARAKINQDLEKVDIEKLFNELNLGRR